MFTIKMSNEDYPKHDQCHYTGMELKFEGGFDLTADDMLDRFKQFMYAFGYHPESVKDAFMDMALEYGSQDSENEEGFTEEDYKNYNPEEEEEEEEEDSGDTTIPRDKRKSENSYFFPLKL